MPPPSSAPAASSSGPAPPPRASAPTVYAPPLSFSPAGAPNLPLLSVEPVFSLNSPGLRAAFAAAAEMRRAAAARRRRAYRLGTEIPPDDEDTPRVFSVPSLGDIALALAPALKQLHGPVQPSHTASAHSNSASATSARDESKTNATACESSAACGYYDVCMSSASEYASDAEIGRAHV